MINNEQGNKETRKQGNEELRMNDGQWETIDNKKCF